MSRASELLRIAQPALSRQIKLLEEELGVELFKRLHNGVALTEAGEKLLGHVRIITRHVERAKQDVSSEGSEPTGWVGLGGPPSINEYLHPPLAARFRTAYPKVVLHLVDGMSTPLIDRLTKKEIDLAIISSAAVQPNILVEPVAREKLLFVAPAGDPRIEGRTVQFNELHNFSLILTGRHNRTRQALESFAAATNVSLNVVMEVESLSSMKRLIKNGLGYALLPPTAVASELADGSLRGIELEGHFVSRYLASRVDDPLSPALEALKTEVRTAFRGMIAQGLIERLD